MYTQDLALNDKGWYAIKTKYWNVTIKVFSDMFSTLGVGGGRGGVVLPLCKDAVGIFKSPRQTIGFPTF